MAALRARPFAKPVPWADPELVAGSADAAPDGGVFQPNP
jgi:hypothetical protein